MYRSLASSCRYIALIALIQCSSAHSQHAAQALDGSATTVAVGEGGSVTLEKQKDETFGPSWTCPKCQHTQSISEVRCQTCLRPAICLLYVHGLHGDKTDFSSIAPAVQALCKEKGWVLIEKYLNRSPALTRTALEHQVQKAFEKEDVRAWLAAPIATFPVLHSQGGLLMVYYLQSRQIVPHKTHFFCLSVPFLGSFLLNSFNKFARLPVSLRKHLASLFIEEDPAGLAHEINAPGLLCLHPQNPQLKKLRNFFTQPACSWDLIGTTLSYSTLMGKPVPNKFLAASKFGKRFTHRVERLQMSLQKLVMENFVTKAALSKVQAGLTDAVVTLESQFAGFTQKTAPKQVVLYRFPKECFHQAGLHHPDLVAHLKQRMASIIEQQTTTAPQTAAVSL